MKIALIQQHAGPDLDDNLRRGRAAFEETARAGAGPIAFAGESFVVDPNGAVIARAPRDVDHILFADCDLSHIEGCHARRHFLPDRRPAFYRKLKLTD
jgi:predicted amidohydrolase